MSLCYICQQGCEILPRGHLIARSIVADSLPCALWEITGKVERIHQTLTVNGGVASMALCCALILVIRAIVDGSDN